MAGPFPLHGVVHLVRPSGHEATDLPSLRTGIDAASPASLFYHAHHPLLRHPFSQTLPPDDFGAWIAGVLRDRETAERVSFAVQSAGGSPATLRDALLAAIPPATGRGEPVGDAPGEGKFTFLEMDPVRIDLGLEAHDPDELVRHLCEDNVLLFFHHVIEWPWFEPSARTAAAWAREQGDPRLADWITESAQDGRPLAEAQRRLRRRWQRSRMVQRVAQQADVPEGVRQAAARNVVSNLVRRIKEG